MELKFSVPGKASPSGSKKAFLHPKTKKIVVMDTAKNKDSWQARVAAFAAIAKSETQITDEHFLAAVEMEVNFHFLRPKSHFGTGKNAGKVRNDAPSFHRSKPDLTKLIRCTEDALTGVLFHDDSQVVQRTASKKYADTEFVEISLKWLV